MQQTITKWLVLLLILMIGALLPTAVQIIRAHGGDTSLIHGCVKTNNGSIRIVGANNSCGNGETALDWNIQGPAGSPGPSGAPGATTICTACNFTTSARVDIILVFNGTDLSNGIFTNANFGNQDLHAFNFRNAKLDIADLNQSNLTDTDFSGVTFTGSGLDNTNLTNANFTNANFTNAAFHNSNFQNTNLTNVNFTGAILLSAINMVTANLTGVTWSNTTCPDGTNSDNNGGTCVGHF